MKYKMNDKRFASVKRFFDEVWQKPDKFPNKSVVLSLRDEEITRIFTKKRLQLIRIIQTKKITFLSELTKLTKRELPAIDRDLKILEGFGIGELEKVGRIIKPSVKKELLIVPLVDFSTKRLETLEKSFREITA